MDDFDFGDWLGDIESGLDISGGDTSWLDDVDWGSMMDTLDFSNLDLSNVIGDVGGGGLFDIAGAGNFLEDVEEQAGGFYGNMPGRAVYDPRTNTTEIYNPESDTFNVISHGGTTSEIFPDFDESEFTRILGEDDGVGTIEIVGKIEDDIEDDLASDFWRNLENKNDDVTSILTDDEHTRTFGDNGAEQGDIVITGKKTDTDDDNDDVGDDDVVCQPGSERRVKQPDGSTKVYDCKGNLIQTIPKADDSCPPNSNVTYTTADGTKIVRDCKGNLISETKPGDTTKKTTTTTTKTDDWTKWAALLGGILGLLGQNKGAPAGYQGGIPKYTATRGPSRSPTEGGRRPGGAGIGSLTGGVTYTPVGAAQGGLMGLAAGGKARPARFLAGGTDGMADKIQTSIDGKQPARLSHGEFVIPADVVSHLGNGNSDAGASVLYEMMAKVRKARTGNPKQGKQINPRKYTPV